MKITFYTILIALIMASCHNEADWFTMYAGPNHRI